MKTTLRYLTLLAGTAMATSAFAQADASAAPASSGRTTAQLPAAQNAMAQNEAVPALKAAEFVQQAAMGNMFEIQSSQLATNRSKNEQITQFGYRLIRDHTQAEQRLKSLGYTVPTNLDDEHTRKISELQSSNGTMFDRRFVQAQVAAHQQTVQLYDRYAQSGDDQRLKQFAQELLPTLRDHLQVAERLNTLLPPDRVGANQPNSSSQQAASSAQAQAGNQAGGDASRIVVQQAAPTVSVDQADPVISVRQPQPSVTVRQGQPQITVRQPQPTVTVDIPQPEIIVRMPRPDVNVAMAQPQVEVRQPQPQVQIKAPAQQAQVQVDRSQPQVQVTRPSGQPPVTVQQAGSQPQVIYERAEPRVIVNQAREQPNVRFEAMRGAPADDQRAGTQPAGRTEASGSAAAGNNVAASNVGETRQLDSADLRQRINAGDDEATGSVPTRPARTRAVAVSVLEDMEVYNAKGEEIGEVDRVVIDNQGRKFLVVGNGGFLGLGRDRVAFPAERFWIRGDRVVIRGVTEEDIENSDSYSNRFNSMRHLSANDRADLRLWQ